MVLQKIYNQYSSLNPEKFNKNFMDLKDNDDVITCFNDIFKALEVIDGVEFMGLNIETDENKYPDIVIKKQKVLNIEESRLNKVNFKFKLTGVDRNKEGKEIKVEEIVEKFIYYPKTLPGYQFLLNGSYYFPIFQIVDAATYGYLDALTLKTLLMPIKVIALNKEFKDYKGDSYKGSIYAIDLFKKKLNYFHYFFPEFGYDETIKFLGLKDHIEIIKYDEEKDDDSYIYFNMNKNEMVKIEKDFYFNNKELVYNYIDIICNGSNTSESIKNIDNWIFILGDIFSRNKNKCIEKSNSVMLSFRRILDLRTKRMLPIRDENKESIYHIVRWMTSNFKKLKSRNNMSLDYKRLRVVEYLLYDLLNRLSIITYRILNTSDATIKNKRDLFSALSPMFLINKLNSNDLLRYIGGVNGIDLFSSRLKFSFRGNQGLGSSKSSVAVNFRGIDPSYIGRICLTEASSTDPGMTGTLVPFMETNGMYFSDISLD